MNVELLVTLNVDLLPKELFNNNIYNMDSTREVENINFLNLNITLITDCFGEHRIVEVFLPRSIAISDLEKLPNVSSKTILQDLPRPFFRVDCPGKFLLTGIIGDGKLRFTLRRAVASTSRDIILQALSQLYATV